MLVYIIAALTADGFIAKSDHHPATWTSPEDKQFFIQKTKQAGVVIMGRKTYQTIGRPLKNRLNVIYSQHPKQIMDTYGATLLDNHTKIHDKSSLYVTQLDPLTLTKKLKAISYKLVAICGGSSIYTLFLASGVVNKLYLTIEPRLFGQGVTLFNQPLNLKLKLIQTQNLSSHTLLLEYDVIK